MPIFLLWIINTPLETLRTSKFKRKFEPVISNLKLKTKWQASYFPIFILRRLLFVLSSRINKEIHIDQILALNYMNLSMLMYQGHHLPLLTKFTNIIECMNEWLIVVVTWHLMLYTDFVPELQFQYVIGWSHVGFISISMFINVLVVFYFSGKYIRLLAIKYFRRMKNFIF
jgi:hypothetical protein